MGWVVDCGVKERPECIPKKEKRGSRKGDEEDEEREGSRTIWNCDRDAANNGG